MCDLRFSFKLAGGPQAFLYCARLFYSLILFGKKCVYVEQAFPKEGLRVVACALYMNKTICIISSCLNERLSKNLSLE